MPSRHRTQIVECGPSTARARVPAWRLPLRFLGRVTRGSATVSGETQSRVNLRTRRLAASRRRRTCCDRRAAVCSRRTKTAAPFRAAQRTMSRVRPHTSAGCRTAAAVTAIQRLTLATSSDPQRRLIRKYFDKARPSPSRGPPPCLPRTAEAPESADGTTAAGADGLPRPSALPGPMCAPWGGTQCLKFPSFLRKVILV